MISIKINPIIIKIKDKWEYSQVAYFVDRDDFLDDIAKARGSLGIRKLFTKKEIEKQFETANLKLTRKEFNKYNTPQKKYSNPNIRLVAPTKYDNITGKLLGKYRKSNNFHFVIKFALICGVVVDKDLGQQQPLIWVANPAKDESKKAIFHFPQIAIVVDPETNPKNLKKSFTDFIKRHKANDKIVGTQWILPDVVSNIERDRKWYWLKQKMSWTELYAFVNAANGQQINDQTIRTAVREYKKKLSVTL